ncbi:MAG: fasciclin domain-containing protein [Calditrichota bacterium]
MLSKSPRSVLLITSAILIIAQTLIAGPRKDIVETAADAGSFTTLLTAAKKAGLVSALQGDGPLTVFAPTDEAFGKLPQGTVENLLKPENRDQLKAILLYHVVEGRVDAATAATVKSAATLNGQRFAVNFSNGKLMVDKSRVVQTDIRASNGIIHVIDQVLLPESKPILTIATEAGTFNTLAAAIKAAGLIETLSGDGPFTVFAPTDKAFAKLPKETLQSLLKPENKEKLQQILTYHVVGGRVYSDAVLQKGSLRTVAGLRVNAALTDGQLMINQSSVISGDIQAANGVIHVIDEVLIPDERISALQPAIEYIELAIDRGVPLYNHGQQRACAAVYEVAAEGLLQWQGLPAEVSPVLQKALAKARSAHNSSNKAWTLRYGLDEAYSIMNDQMRMTSR